MTLEQIQAMWDRWQEAPDIAVAARISHVDGKTIFTFCTSIEEAKGPQGTFAYEPLPPAEIGVLLGVIDRVDADLSEIVRIGEAPPQDRLIVAVAKNARAAIAGEQE